jgi:hypothetical protein
MAQSNHLNFEQARKIVELTFPEYSKVRSEYWRKVYEAVNSYLNESTNDEDWFKHAMKTAVELAFLHAALVAWTDGGEEGGLSVSATAFVAAYTLAEFGFIESLVLSLRLIKYAPPEDFDIIGPEGEVAGTTKDIKIMETARKRADGYAQGLDMLYNNLKVRAAGNKLLLFTGDDGMESCFDCQKYKGLKKPASWWILNNAVPPNRDFECKGYRCLHVLIDEKGHIFTI